jgi:hypothetical protein
MRNASATDSRLSTNPEPHPEATRMPTMKTFRLAATLVSITLAAAAGGALAQDRMRTEGDSGNASSKLSQPSAPRTPDAMKNSATPHAPTFDRMRTEGDSGNASDKLSQPSAPGTAGAMKNSETARAATLDRMRAEGDSSNPENKLSQPR